MQLSRRLRSRSRVGRLRNRVRAVLSTGSGGIGATAAGASDDTESGGDETGSDAPGNLFHCSTCGIVYIGAEKRVCSQCDGDVEQVRSTLRR